MIVEEQLLVGKSLWLIVRALWLDLLLPIARSSLLLLAGSAGGNITR